jgi:murein L,D-transpeptidase YcbB/YkuD
MKKSVTFFYTLLLTCSGLGCLAATVVNADSLSREIRRQLGSPAGKKLLFPQSVKRFYASRSFHSAWFKPQTGEGPTWQAMLLIDCTEQFGLAGVNYHQNELSYNTLHDILETPGTISAARQARFDMLLSDAMIAYMNHLHYGRKNPAYPAGKVDRGIPDAFHAEKMLIRALGQTDLISVITSVQPTSKQYRDLQYQLYMLLGVHSGDNYQVSAADIKGMTLSMERLRWASAAEGPFIQVNIAAYTLTLYEPDSAYVFRIIVGNPQHQTARIPGAISNLVTAAAEDSPRMALPRLSTLLPEIIPEKPADRSNLSYPGAAGSFTIRPQGRREQKQFDREQRDLSDGSIRVEHPEKLAALLLRYDGAENKVAGMNKALRAAQVRTFRLNKKVPVKITYLTYLMKDGGLVTYKDIYGLDRSLEKALFPGNTQFVINY